MEPEKSDTDPGEDGSVHGMPDSGSEGAPEYEPVAPRWGSENEVTTVFTGDSALHAALHGSEQSLGAIVERAQRAGRMPPLLVVLDILSQASSLLLGTNRPKGPTEDVLAHGRLNPHRIFVSREGLVRIDWHLDSPGPSPETVSSEDDYLSPEQLRGLPIDARSDVFSLTLSVCELLVAKRLVSDRTKVLAGPGVTDLATALRNGKRIPRELARVILHGLAKDAEQRFSHVGELRAAMREAGDELGLFLDHANTARFLRELFDENQPRDSFASAAELTDEELQAGSDFDRDEPAGLDGDDADEDEERDDDEEEDEGDDLDDEPMPEWGSLDVFASLAKSTSTPPPPAWASSLTRTAPPPPLSASVPPPPAHVPAIPPPPIVPPARAMAAAVSPPIAPPVAAPASRPLPPPVAPPQAARPRASAPPPEASRTLPPPPPPLLSPPPMRGRTSGVSVDIEAKRPLDSEPPSALTRSVLPRWPVPAGLLRGGLRSPVSWRTLAVLGALVVLAILLVPLLTNRQGTVVVAAAGNLGQPLGNVTVSVDDLKTCDGLSRCTFQLAPGLHEMNVRADGYVGQQRVIVVRAGEQSAIEFRLERSISWLKLAARQDGTEVFVDEELAGVLPNQMPQTIEIASGPHKVRIAAKHFAPEEQKVDLAPGETRFLGGIALRAIIGKATFDVRTTGADLMLVSETGQQQHVDPAQPIELDLSKRWVLEAHRDGYATLREPLEWNGNLEKTFPVSLERPSAESPAPRAVAAPRPAVRMNASPSPAAVAAAPAPMAAEPEPAPAEPTAAVPAGACSLSFNSIPVSSVFLDGARIGSTPQLRVPIRPGNHTVEFAHGEVKKRRSFHCGAGEAKVIALNLGP